MLQFAPTWRGTVIFYSSFVQMQRLRHKEMKWISHDQTINRTVTWTMQLQMLVLEAELLAEMLLAVVEAGFSPKVQWGHRSTSWPWKAMANRQGGSHGRSATFSTANSTPGRMQRLGPGHSTEILLSQQPPVYPALSSPIQNLFCPWTYSPLTLTPTQLDPHILLQLSCTTTTSTASHPCFPIPCDMNGLTLSGGSLVCLQDDWMNIPLQWHCLRWVWFQAGSAGREAGVSQVPRSSPMSAGWLLASHRCQLQSISHPFLSFILNV